MSGDFDITQKPLDQAGFERANLAPKAVVSTKGGVKGVAARGFSYLANIKQTFTDVKRQVTLLDLKAGELLENHRGSIASLSESDDPDEAIRKMLDKTGNALLNLKSHGELVHAFKEKAFIRPESQRVLGEHEGLIAQLGAHKAKLELLLKAKTAEPAYLAAHQLIDELEQRDEQMRSTEGIFRISGSLETCDELQKRLLAGEEVDLESERNVNNLATLLKRVLNETENPILDIKSLPDSPTDDQYKALVQGLNAPNRSLLQRLIILSEHVVASTDKNLMNYQSLATTLGANLTRTEDSDNMEEAGAAILNAATHIEKLLKLGQWVFSETDAEG